MSNKLQLQTNNASLITLIDRVNAAKEVASKLPESTGGNTNIEDALINKTLSGTYENSRITNIGSHIFRYCTSLQSVSFPACTSIGGDAFHYCTYLTSISFPVCTTIGSYAFEECSSLQSVNFPACTSIGSRAFKSCTSLSNLTLGASTVCTLANSNAFESTPYAGYSSYFSGTPYIYVPSSLVASYQTATNWTYFSSYISAIDGVTSGETINFLIDDVEYTANVGMTWEEWCDSDYNTGGFYIDDEEYVYNGTKWVWEYENGDGVAKNSGESREYIITNENNYYLNTIAYLFD